MIVEKIYKYPTGAIIPKDAKYLSTITQTSEYGTNYGWSKCFYVWHYFLVKVEEKE